MTKVIPEQIKDDLIKDLANSSEGDFYELGIYMKLVGFLYSILLADTEIALKLRTKKYYLVRKWVVFLAPNY